MKKRDLFRLPLGNYILTDGIYKFSLKKQLREYGDNLPYYSVREYGSLSGGSVNFYEEIDNVFDNTSRYKQMVLTFMVFITGMSFCGDDCWNQIHKLKFVSKSSYKEWLKKVECLNIKPKNERQCGKGQNIA